MDRMDVVDLVDVGHGVLRPSAVVGNCVLAMFRTLLSVSNP
jgi:hypothetical protein